MGTSYYGHTILGIELRIESLSRQMKVKAFEHNYPEHFKVDPEDGKPLWKMETVLHERLVPKYKGEALHNSESMLGDFTVIVMTDHRSGMSENKRAFIGILSTVNSWKSYSESMLLSLERITKLKADLETTAQDLAIANSFGLHSFMDFG